MGQAAGIGGLLAAVALQEPEQQGRQILLAPGARRPAARGLERAQQVAQAATDPAAGQAAAQGGVVGIHELATDGGEEMEVAHQIDGGWLATGGDRLGGGAAEIPHEGHGRAESVQGGLDGRAQFGGVLGTDADGVQHPAAPSVETQEQPALAFVAGGVDVQGIAVRHGAAQGRSPQLVQGLQQVQEAIAEGGDRAVREDDAALGEGGADFLTLAHVVIALQSDPDDQVVAVALSRGCQVGQLLRAQRRGGAARAVAPEFAVGGHIFLTSSGQIVLTVARQVLSLCYAASEREVGARLLESSVGQRLTRCPALKPCSN